MPIIERRRTRRIRRLISVYLTQPGTTSYHLPSSNKINRIAVCRLITARCNPLPIALPTVGIHRLGDRRVRDKVTREKRSSELHIRNRALAAPIPAPQPARSGGGRARPACRPTNSERRGRCRPNPFWARSSGSAAMRCARRSRSSLARAFWKSGPRSACGSGRNPTGTCWIPRSWPGRHQASCI